MFGCGRNLTGLVPEAIRYTLTDRLNMPVDGI
jgi:hypothetical protein